MSSASALRLASRHVSMTSPTSIDVVGRLDNFILLATVASVMMLAAVAWLSQQRLPAKVVVTTLDFNLEVMPEPPVIPPPDAKISPALARIRPATNPAISANQTVTNAEKKLEAQAPVAAASARVAATVPAAPISVVKPPSEPASPVQPVALTEPEASPVQTSGGIDLQAPVPDTRSIAGDNFGQKELMALSMVPSRLSAKGNIAPYKRDLVVRLQENWQPKGRFETVEVLIALNKEGNLLDRKVVKGTGNKNLDQDLVKAIDRTQFAALPEWFSGEKLQFRLRLTGS